ncbi:MAG: hypothetical protein JO332_00715, partial [Planctomycetaceae bacterium]|nr:hypothetical protein [Planctomycetaceae bacterium]
MPKKPVFSLPKAVARAITFLLIFCSFWAFDSFFGELRSIAAAREARPSGTAAALKTGAIFRVPQSTLPVELVKISTGFNGLIGMDYLATQDKVLFSVNYPSGGDHNFEVIDHNGDHQQFTGVNGLGDEVYIACVRDTMGGFEIGDTFTGNGRPGEILKMSGDGQTIVNPWVKLPNEPGLLRGGLCVDRTGAFGGDLIVVTTAGNVWRVNSDKQVQILAHLNDGVEGPTTVPIDPVRYGPWSGTILAAAEGSGRIYSITPQGAVRFDALGISAEGCHVIPPKQNFFISCFGAGTLMGASASNFVPYVGDVLIAEEFAPNIWVVRWDGTAFQKTLIAQGPAGFEGSCFAPAGVVEVPPITPPPTLTLSPPQTIQATGPGGATASISASTSALICTLLQLTWSVDGLPAERVDTFPVVDDGPSSGSAAYSRLYAPGSHTITVTAIDSINQRTTAQTTVTVIGQPPVKTLTSIAVTPATSQLNIGQTETLTATGTYSDG